MSTHKQLLNELQDHLHESEGYAAYAAKVARHYRSRDTFSKWVVAVAACGPFIDKLAGTSQEAASWLLALIPLVAIALPLLNYSKKIEIASSLHGKYVEIIPRLRDLWRELCADENPPDTKLRAWRKEMSDLDTRLSEIRVNKSQMPDITSLAKKAEAIAKKYHLPAFALPDKPEQKESSYYGGATVVNYKSHN